MPASVVKRHGRSLFNLYLGLNAQRYPAVAEPQARCARLLDYFDKVLGHSDTDPDGFIWRWLAWCVQNTSSKSGVAIVLRGIPGSGKSTFQKIMQGLFAPYGFVTSQSSQLFGRFNGQLAQQLFVGCEEALWANNGQEADGAKALITDTVMGLERKYQDAEPAATFMNVVVTTNHEFAAPVSKGDRRYAVFDMENKDLLSREQWRQIDEVDLKQGSPCLAALWQVLNTTQLDGWVPRHNIPANKARAKQKVEALGGSMGAAMRHLLECDDLPGVQKEDDWDNGPVKIVGKHGKGILREHLREWWKALPQREKKGKLTTQPSDRIIADALKHQLGMNPTAYGGLKGNERAWSFADRATCIETFEDANNLAGGLD
jgi:energy-coupling factor transporter ATP-binding protein EcfA2